VRQATKRRRTAACSGDVPGAAPAIAGAAPIKPLLSIAIGIQMQRHSDEKRSRILGAPFAVGIGIE
jgi:hypothetical protein